MRRALRFSLALAVVVSSGIVAKADDKAREWVDKAIQAHGGETLAKFPAATARMKGAYHGMGAAIDFTGEVLTQGFQQQKVVIDVEAGGEKLRITHLLNRDKAWIAYNDQTEELEGEDLAEAKEQAYSEWVCTLAPLKEKTFTLSIVG